MPDYQLVRYPINLCFITSHRHTVVMRWAIYLFDWPGAKAHPLQVVTKSVLHVQFVLLSNIEVNQYFYILLWLLRNYLTLCLTNFLSCADRVKIPHSSTRICVWVQRKYFEVCVSEDFLVQCDSVLFYSILVPTTTTASFCATHISYHICTKYFSNHIYIYIYHI